MITAIPRYGKYADSGSKAIGAIPAHWQTLRAKVLFREVDERSVSGGETLLSVSHISGVRSRSELGANMFLAKSNVGHKLCQPTDLVINTMWAWMGALGVSHDSGIVSPAYAVYRQRSQGTLLPEYAHYLLRTPGYVAEYTIRSSGIHSSRLRLYPDHFLVIPLVVPTPPEQAAIALYLNHAERSVCRYVAAKRKLIDLLAEKREAATEEALRSPDTKSLRLGSVAERLERAVDRRREGLFTPVGLFNRGRGIFHKRAIGGRELGESTFFWIEEGDLVLSGQFAWEGAVAIASDMDAGCIASHRYPILRGRPHLATSAYLLAFLKTQMGTQLLNHHCRGAAGRNRPLNLRTLLKEKIPVPPFAVQQHIEELVLLEARLSDSVARTIQTAREYLAKIVTDVATGQFDVRDAVRNLSADEHDVTLPDDLEPGVPEDEEDLEGIEAV